MNTVFTPDESASPAGVVDSGIKDGYMVLGFVWLIAWFLLSTNIAEIGVSLFHISPDRAARINGPNLGDSI